MATNGRNRRLEPAYKQHAVVDDICSVVLDVEATTGEINEGQVVLGRIDAAAATTGKTITTVTADAGYAYGKVYAGMEGRGIDPLIRLRPNRSRVRCRCVGSATTPGSTSPNARAAKCCGPAGRSHMAASLQSRPRLFPLLHASLCLSKGRLNKALVISDEHPALLRARRRRERWSEEDQRLYQRHRWRSEGFHGEAETWHGLGRCRTCVSRPS